MSIVKLKVKGILFDLDGTIVDSKEAYIAAAKKAFLDFGMNPPEKERALEIPKRLEQSLSIANIINGCIVCFLEVYMKTYYSVTKEKTRPFPNVQATLEKLSQNAKLGLVTMRFASKTIIAAELEHFHLAKYFTQIVTAKDASKPKPSPEALVKAVKALDINASDCLMVGDSVVDIRAGKAAGTQTVAVMSGLYSRSELALEQPDLILDNVTQLLGHVDFIV